MDKEHWENIVLQISDFGSQPGIQAYGRYGAVGIPQSSDNGLDLYGLAKQDMSPMAPHKRPFTATACPLAIFPDQLDRSARRAASAKARHRR